MKRMAGTLWMAALLMAAVATTADAQSSNSDRTIWDGVYTDAQATRGQREVQQNCSACHSPSEWSNNRFLIAWSGRPIGALHSHIRNTMPFDSPGRLTPKQYADIVAYMLKLNNVPAGEEELPEDDEGLLHIGVTRPATR